MKRRIDWANVCLLISMAISIVMMFLTPKFVEYGMEHYPKHAYSQYYVWLLPLLYVPLWVAYKWERKR